MNEMADALAWLTGAVSQNERLLRLVTPLGSDTLLAERLSGDEAIGPCEHAGLRFTLHALSTDIALDMTRLIGQPVLLQLEQADASLRAWHAHVTRVAQEGSDGGYVRWRLTLEPWLAFLGHRQDSWVFQDTTVMQIVDEVFADWSQGTLAPAWRWELADAGAYPRRSLCIQYQETDLAFVQRLLREEGLFCWFEHEAAPEDDSLGSHTLVIADHNGAIGPNAQDRVRYTQAGAGLTEDSLVRWRRQRQVQAARLSLASPDYRSGPQDAALRPVSAEGSQAPVPQLAVTDVPGQYAYEDSTQGQRLAQRQMQAIDAKRERATGHGTCRRAAPGTHFTLTDHPVHDGWDGERDCFAILAVHHEARSNLQADPKAGLDPLAQVIRADGQVDTTLANQRDEAPYECTITAQRLAVPIRIAAEDDGTPDPRLNTRPTIEGVQTALVVGLQGPIHTDRDHRIKIQFHWQRGGNASHRLDHPGGDNAPASDASGTWVRVAEQIAGANWGSVFTPRLGQEVLVGFIGGDIDRPVVIGAVYNGQGQADAQSNQVAGGAAGATGNAPAWFPGAKAEGSLQAHQHPAVLSGYKSQELSSSQSGTGGHNQMVMDDSAGEGRIELATSSANTRLQLGHLRHQIDNRRQQQRGHGLDLATQAWGAVRAAQGLLISAHGKPASTAHAQQLDTREPRTQLQQSAELVKTLKDSAQVHNAKLEGEAELSVEKALKASDESLGASEQQGGGDGEIGGGAGTIPTLARPDIVLAAPAGIAAMTPAHTLASAGGTASFVAGQDLQHMAQENSSTAVKDGLVFFTYGQAQNPDKPNTETGIQFHAATGNVNTQSQSGATKITADKAVSVASTTGMVKVTAPQHVLLTAAGAAIRIEGGNITLSGPGSVEFRAGMKELGGGKAVSPDLPLIPRPIGLTIEPGDQHFQLLNHDGSPVAGRRYRASTGNELIEGFTDAQGRSDLLEGYIGQLARFELVSSSFDEYFVLHDSSGRGLSNFPYVIRSSTGAELRGVTDADGRTSTFSGDIVEDIWVEYLPPEVDADEGCG